MARKNVLNRAVDSPQEPMADGLVTVRANGWIREDDVTYKPGDKFKTSPERADALGKQVEILS